jgi:Uma2 family endonuclease
VLFTPRDVFRPDVLGWRRDRYPERPVGFPIHQIPDWVCEVLSPSTAHYDLGYKRRVYHGAKVGRYWVIDVEQRSLTVMRWSMEGYVILEIETVEGRVRAPPFEGVEIQLDELFGG